MDCNISLFFKCNFYLELMEFIHALWSENTSTWAEILSGTELHQIFSLNSVTT